MQQFVIPQFIDAEDKIIGPITVRQFILLIIGGGIEFLLYRLADFTLFLALGVPFGTVVVVLAFVPINGRPIHFFLLNLLETLKRPRLRIWDNAVSSAEARTLLLEERAIVQGEKQDQTPGKPPLQKSRLAELSLIVDTGGSYGGEQDVEPPKQ